MRARHVTAVVTIVAMLAALPMLVGGIAQATVLDLTTSGASGTINGAIYNQGNAQPTGTGVIDPFERMQATGTEQGYNTDASGVMDNLPWPHTADTLLAGAATVNIGGTDYLEFLLDINQTGSNPLLSLNEVQIFQTGAAGQSVTSFTGGVLDLADATLAYRMDAGADSTVNLDSSLGHGSGSGDMNLFVPASYFDFSSNQGYLVLYSSFGNPNPSNDGYEEWAVLRGDPPVVPEPATMSLLGLGIAAIAVRRFRGKH